MVTWGVTDVGTDREVAFGPTGDRGQNGLDAILDQLDERREGDPTAIPRETTDCYSGRATMLRVPGTDAVVSALDCDAQYTLSKAAELPDGAYLLSVTVATNTGGDPFATNRHRLHIRFDGSASLQENDSGIVVSLWQRQRVTVAVGEPDTAGPTHIQVPETVEGLATGISHLSAGHHTFTPSRSHPGQRSHPPFLTTGETESIPDELTGRATGIRLQLPACTESLFVAAPLAYYLGANVTVADRERAVLTAEGTDIRREFSPLPAFQEEVAELLQRVFYLDCLVRRMDPEQAPGLLEQCSLDPDSVRTMTPAGRLERYLQTPADAVAAATPEWHLSTHTEPSLAKARCLPFLLDNLSLIYLSDGSELARGELLDRTLSDSYLTRGGSASSGAMVDPNQGVGHLHGWLAPGTPIDAFKTTPAAYENRFRYGRKESDHLQLSVVLNETEMSEEHGAVSEIYRAADLPMVVSVREQLTTDELADVFESDHDLVHFIGHCEDDGLCCPDGTLSTDSLSESRARTFFLNACGSYEQGLSLIEQGSVAGAVTFTDVLDSHAAMVGTAFARLLSNGFTIQRALQLARRRIMMGKDYAVVGDGTYALLPGPEDPVVAEVTDTGTGYELTCEVITPGGAGASYQVPFDGGRILNGTATEMSVSAEALIETLETHSMPVIFDGEFHWSEDLAARLHAGL